MTVLIPLFVITSKGCASERPQSAEAGDLRAESVVPQQRRCGEVGRPAWTKPGIGLGSAGDELLLQDVAIYLWDPREEEPRWVWRPRTTLNERDSQGRGPGLTLTVPVPDRRPAEILEVVGDEVVFSDGGAYAGVIDLHSGETLAAFGDARHFRIEYETERFERAGGSFSADERGVYVESSSGRVTLVDGAEMYSCAEDRLIMVEPSGAVLELDGEGNPEIGRFLPKRPHAVYTEGEFVGQVVVDGTRVSDDAGRCWETPTAAHAIVAVSTGYAVLAETEEYRIGAANSFLALGGDGVITPCRRVMGRPIIQDLRPVPSED